MIQYILATDFFLSITYTIYRGMHTSFKKILRWQIVNVHLITQQHDTDGEMLCSSYYDYNLWSNLYVCKLQLSRLGIMQVGIHDVYVRIYNAATRCSRPLYIIDSRGSYSATGTPWHTMSTVGLLFTALVMGACSQSRALSDAFTSSVFLDDEETFHLEWTANKTAGCIQFQARVKTHGWIGLGFSPDGQMSNSDVIIGWVRDSRAFLQVQ